jgi:RNA polymerase sigma factor (sigma-70 family)
MASDRFIDSSDPAMPARAVYERYRQALRQYLVRRVHRPEDIEDLTQEIFELFVRRKDQTKVIRDPMAYLFRIAFHVVGTALAEEQRSPVTLDLQGVPRAADLETGSSSSEDAEELAAQHDMQAALAQLPANYLTALMLVEGQGMSYKEAAKATGFTPSTIAAYVMHARAALKLALDGRWEAKVKVNRTKDPKDRAP